MRKLFKSFVAVCAFLFASTAYGQLSQRLPAIVISGSGRPVAGAQIFVCAGTVTPNFSANPPCTLASIFSDVAGQNAITQPLLSDGLGNYTWFAAQGNYTEVVMARGIQSYSVPITIGGASGSGNVVGPNLSVSTDLPTFSDTTGKVLSDSGIAVTKAALKPVTSDAVQFVSANGNDTNDGFSMGSAKLTVAAAQTALPSGGGVIEVLPFTSLSLSAVQPIGTGVGGKAVQLRLDPGATITVNTASAGSCQFAIGQGSSISGAETGQGNVGHIFFSSSANLKYGFCPAATNGTQQLWGLANLDIENVSGQAPTISDSVIYASTTGQNSSVQNVTVAGIPAILLHVQGSSVAGTGSFYFANDWFNCEAVAGCAPAKIDTVAPSQAVGNIFFFATDFEHSPSGTPEFNLDGSASPGAITNVSLVGSYCEGSFAANNCFNIKDAKSFHLQNITCDGVAGADCIHLSESTTTGLGFGTIENVSDPNGYTNLINDTINSNVLASPANSGALPLYIFTNPNFSEGPSLFSGAVETKSVASLSANPAQSGILRCADGDICAAWRNHAGTADVGFSKDTSDNLKFNGNFLPPLTGTLVGGRCVQDVLTGSVVTYVEAANPCGTGGTGSPGGSANQLQFNSAGAFGGIAGSTATANGGISFFPAADTPGLAVHPFATAISDPFQVFAETAVSVPSTPSLGQVAGGTLGSRTDFVQIAYAGYSGVFTTYSAQQSRAVSVNNLLTVTSPSATTGAAGWLPAIASTTNGETNLETVTSANCTLATGLPENAPAMCAIGANWTEPTTGFNASGPAKPASNLTQVKAFSVDSSGNIHCQNCAVPVSNGFTASAAQPIGVDSTTGLFHSWTGGADAVDTQKAGAWTAGDCLKANDTVGGIADAGVCGAGGGGSSAWSALTAPAANLTLAMGGFTSEFDQTSAVDKTFFLNNTTPATISTTNQSPKFNFGINDWVSSASTPESVSLSAKQEVAGSNIVSLLLNSSQTASGTQVDFTAAATNFVNNDWEFNGVKLTPTSTGSASSKVIGGYLGTGTNVSGANFDYQCDIGTGNTLPCDQVIQSGTFSTTSGTTRQTSVNRFVPAHYISGLSTGVAATIDTVTMGVGQPISFKYTVTVVATDGTNSCTAQGTFSVSGTDTAGTIVANVSSLAETSTACTSGDTLSFTAAASAASPMVVSVTPTLAGITPTSFIAIVELHGYSTIGDTLP